VDRPDLVQGAGVSGGRLDGHGAQPVGTAGDDEVHGQALDLRLARAARPDDVDGAAVLVENHHAAVEHRGVRIAGGLKTIERDREPRGDIRGGGGQDDRALIRADPQRRGPVVGDGRRVVRGPYDPDKALQVVVEEPVGDLGVRLVELKLRGRWRHGRSFRMVRGGRSPG
jgi:hypothetical protein